MTRVGRRPIDPLLHHRGFAAVMAIVLIGLVAATLAALGMMFTAEARRTRSEAADAQLRQLLIAGAAEAKHRVTTGSSDFQVAAAPLPAALAQAGATLSLAPATASNDNLLVTVTATLGPRRSEQRLLFTRDGSSGWRLDRVESVP